MIPAGENKPVQPRIEPSWRLEECTPWAIASIANRFPAQRLLRRPAQRRQSRARDESFARLAFSPIGHELKGRGDTVAAALSLWLDC